MTALPNDDQPQGPGVPRTGQVVGGRYEITGELGRGSTGVVWDARDTTTGDRVAVKILHDSLVLSPPVRKRFHREAAAARALEHPHSVRVLADGVTPDGADFLVMERLEGRTLSAELEACGAMPQARAIGIVAQILDATAEAHRRGIVHRDLKPGNVMLVAREDGMDFVKVCDYGLAKEVVPEGGDVANASFSTMQGVLCGTPAYMSPEQARGESLDGRTDLYAISVMLFRLVVGRLPFEARTAVDVISAHLATPPPRPRSVRPDLDIASALENLILRGLAKNRRERPASADVYRADLLQVGRDLARDLKEGKKRAWTDETVQSDGPAPRPFERPPAASRSKVRVAVGIALALGAVGSVVAFGVRRGEIAARTSPPAPLATPVAAAPARVEPPAPPPAAPAPAGAPHPASAVKKRHLEPKRAVEARSAPKVEPPTETKNSVVAKDMTADLLRQAEEAMGNGHLEDARALGLAAAEHNPSSAAAWEFLGRCYMRLGRADEARSFYRRALALAPNGPNAAYLRAIVESNERSRPK